jgi:hypothetical protein
MEQARQLSRDVILDLADLVRCLPTYDALAARRCAVLSAGRGRLRIGP